MEEKREIKQEKIYDENGKLKIEIGNISASGNK